MEREELEQVPWSSLTMNVERRTDRRWYALGGLLVALVVAIVGLRFLSTPGQPTPPPATVAATVPDPGTTTPSGGTLMVAEDELRTPSPPDPGVPMAVGVRAEWFVMDYFTHDGSAETARSVREALAPDLGAAPLPHDGHGDPVASTFVEWARVLDVTPLDDGSFVATVAYRSIHGQDEGFVRDPVVAVSLTIRGHDGAYLVATLPSPTSLPGGLRPASPSR